MSSDLTASTLAADSDLGGSGASVVGVCQRDIVMPNRRVIIFDGEPFDITNYWRMHENRFRHSIAALRQFAKGRVLEVGGHPWAMTSLMADTPGFELAATVSAEECTR